MYGLTNQQLCYIQICKSWENKTKIVLENGWLCFDLRFYLNEYKFETIIIMYANLSGGM